MLLKAQKKQEDLENIKFLILLKKMNLDTSDSKELNEFNNLLKEYNDLIIPAIATERDKFSKDLKPDLTKLDIKNFNLAKLKLSKDTPVAKNISIQSTRGT